MDELTKLALVGTQKAAGPLPTADHPAAMLVMGLAAEDRERALLLYFGARAVYDMAGRQPITGIESVAPAPLETNNVASPTVAVLLQNIITSGETDLLIDCLRQMQERRLVLPPEVLPVLLQSKEAAVRRGLIPILGERGRWLCRQNPDWSSFEPSAVDETRVDILALNQTWNEGTIDERCRALAILRRHDPPAARDWVARVFAKEKANHRVKLVEALGVGLGDEDEAFLDLCQGDRSAAVGVAAAHLLCRLPRSALAGRMRDRAAAILALERTGILVKHHKLVCTPPQEIGRDWERDGIPKQAPAGQGERAYWTERVLAVVPPSFWQAHFGLGPQALIAAAAEDPFAASVMAGWARAAAAFAANDPASADWLVPLWRHRAGSMKVLQGRDRLNAIEGMRALLPHIAPNLAESEVEDLFEPGSGWEDAVAFRLVLELRAPWSARFASSFLAHVRRRLQARADQAAMTWANVLARRASAVPAQMLPLALAPWDVAAPEEAATWFATRIQGEIDKFITTIKLRQSFMTELNRSS